MNGILTLGRSFRGRVIKGAIAVALAVSLVQGCIVTEKRLLDIYSDVFTIQLGVEVPLITLGFPNNYTIPPGWFIFNGRFKDAPNPPSQFNLIMRYLDPTGAIVNTWTFGLNVRSNGKIPKQRFQFPGLAILAAYSLQWAVLAVAGAPGALIEGPIRFKGRYRAQK